MGTNVLPLDRAIRAWAGLLLLATPLLELSTYPYNLLGLVLIVTAIAGYCPLYAFAHKIREGFGSQRAPAFIHSSRSAPNTR